MAEQHCKECGKALDKCHMNANQKFCGRKCRKDFMKSHEVKGAKKRQSNVWHHGAAFDSDGNSVGVA